jgi:hypothetical protein
MFQHLARCALVDPSIPDDWVWGKKGYTIKEGYMKLLLYLPSSPKSRIWQHAWQGDSLPKVNTFSCVMVHRKLLTTENIQKIGI